MATFSSHLPCRIPARLLKRPFMLHSVSAKCENLQPEALSVAWRGRVARLVPSVGVLDMLCALFARLFIGTYPSQFDINRRSSLPKNALLAHRSLFLLISPFVPSNSATLDLEYTQKIRVMSSIRPSKPVPVRPTSNNNTTPSLSQSLSKLPSQSPLSRFLNNEEPTISSRLSLLGGSSDHHTLKSPKSRLFDDDDLLFLPAGDFDYSQSERAIAMFNRDVDAVLLLEKSALEKMQFDGRRKMKTI